MAVIGGSCPLSITIDSVTTSSANNYYWDSWDSVPIAVGGGGGSGGCAVPACIIQYEEKKMPDIGGTCCHLCGKTTNYKNTYQRYNKKDNWVTRVYLTYKCGTEIFTNEKGVKKVTLGSKCIKPPVNG